MSSVCIEQPTENVPVFIADTESERGYIGERNYFPEYTEFCREFRSQARASGAGYPSAMDCQAAYGRAQRETDEANEYAERDRLEEQQRIAGECAEYTSGIPTHVAFRKAHDFLSGLEQKSRRTFHVADFAADLNLAAFHALRDDLTAWAFYCLVRDGAASDVPAHALTRSEMWYEVRSLVGAEIIRRGLLNGYFKKRRNGRAR